MQRAQAPGVCTEMTTDVHTRLAAYRARKAAERDSPAPASVGAHPTGVEDRQGVAHAAPAEPVEDEEPPTEGRTLTSWQRLALHSSLWLALLGAFVYFGFGTLFLLLSLFYLMWASLRGSRRRPWEPSAYSVFNEGCEAIDGTLKAEQFDREIRFRT